jgi:hypothetical protein
VFCNCVMNIPFILVTRQGHINALLYFFTVEINRLGEDRCVYRVLVGKPEGKRPLGRPIRSCRDNIKMDLQEVGGVVGLGLSWLRIWTGSGHLWVR